MKKPVVNFKDEKPFSKSPFEYAQEFWAASDLTFFGQKTISHVCGVGESTLENNRWRRVGIPFRKIGGRVLYRKSDVIKFIESHDLVGSTSEYKKGDGKHD